MQKLLFACFLCLTVFFLSSFSQTPAQIDVTSLTIYKRGNTSSMTMSASGLPAPYQSPLQGVGEGTLYQLENSIASRIGDTYPTSFVTEFGNLDTDFGGFYTGFRLGSYGDNHRVRFRATGTSPRLVISPRIPMKKRLVTLTVEAKFKGRIEIYNSNTLVAVDNEVDLTGVMKANFLQYRWETQNYSRRAFDFTEYTFSYSQ